MKTSLAPVVLVLILSGCSRMSEDSRLTVAEVNQDKFKLLVSCSEAGRSCEASLYSKVESEMIISEKLTFPWGYHYPIITARYDDVTHNVVVKIDPDFGEGTMEQSIPVPQVLW